ncbi:MAG: polysaccharide biosynthesis protein [Clostridia bacterium]|jgi:stage V sporulation protein B|nr:polysaccharide biosynthesis protein [Clostridia bacterium]
MSEVKTKIKKETFMQGVVTIMFSQILIKVLGLIYTLYLTNREGFGDAGNAIYASGYQIYALLLTISSIGVPNAISKLVSERLAVGDNKGANKIFKVGLATFGIIGAVGTIVLFFGAHTIAYSWIQIPEAELTLIALSPAIFFVSISSVFRGYFNGRRTLKTTARAQTLEQVFKTILTIVIVELVAIITSTSTEMMAAGANIATTIATFSSFAYLFAYYKVKRKEIGNEIEHSINYKYENVKAIIRKILMVSIPLTLSSIMTSFNKNIDSFTVKRILSTYMPELEATTLYGQLSGKIDTLTNLPLAINIAFATALVPAIAAAKAQNDRETATKRTSFSLLTSMLIGLPCVAGMIIFAQPILNLLYPNANEGALLLQLIAFSVMFSILDQTINGALQGFGKVMVPAIALGIGCFAKLILNIVLLPIPELNVYGAAIGSIVCHFVAFTIVYSVLKKNVKLDLPFRKFILKPALATGIMGVCSYTVYLILDGMKIGSSATIISILFAIVIYLLAVVALKIYNKDDIYMLPKGEKIYKLLKKSKIY